jgi:NADPH-dependent glutamate synthase beta subunit-like oxidoreductase/2,4-dienoyl-CoA reductase-like NADH-dependent reductase (Old Yellow Enzyme family)
MDKTIHQRFRFHSPEELMATAREMALDLPFDRDTAILLEPVAIGSRRAPNRFLAQPMEGFDALPDGAPGELSFRRYRRYASGGFGVIWIEATAVAPEARSNPGQLYLHEGSAAEFARLVTAIRATAREAFGHEVVVIVQLTHSGRYSKPSGVPAPIIAHHSPILDPIHKLAPDYPLISDDTLDRLQEGYVAVARLAAQAGVDGVDIKSCHRYLVSELLASFTREGRYGGAFENRARFLLETAARIRDALPGLFVTTRMNAYDAIPHPYGFGVSPQDPSVLDLAEPLDLARRLATLRVPLLNVSIGNPYFNPHHGRPFDFPVHGAAIPAIHPLAGIERFVRVTRAFQNELPGLPVVASGYSWLRQFMPNVGAAVIRSGGATLLGIGRGAFAYPNTPRDLMAGRGMDPAKCCVACSACTQIMRDGGKTGCVVRDSEIYGPQYRLARRFALDRLQEEARRCRECVVPTCSDGCPAHVDIPTFLRAFADGDIARAYAVLRASNVLPEMCGFVCPSEAQCEGGCVEAIFCQNPLPIRDIQLVTCRIARRQGIVGARFPEKPSGRRVAIVGGGPAGLAGAIRLVEMGHHVAIFDRGSRLGGIPDTTIPLDRYESAENEVEAILAPALRAGRVLTCFGRSLGDNLSLDDLRAEYDAVLLAFGLTGSPTPLGRRPGVVDAIEFLAKVKTGDTSGVPPRVAVIGSGNTAVDAAVVAKALGARDVYLLYRRSFAEMPAWPSEKERLIASGVHVLVLTQPTAYLGDAAGRLAGIRIARTELGEPDASGRRRPAVAPGTETVLDVGLAIEAIGQTIPDSVRDALDGVRFTDAGLVATVRPDAAATHAAKVFAAGDLVNGGSTAVRAVAEGMRAAEDIHRALA